MQYRTVKKLLVGFILVTASLPFAYYLFGSDLPSLPVELQSSAEHESTTSISRRNVAGDINTPPTTLQAKAGEAGANTQLNTQLNAHSRTSELTYRPGVRREVVSVGTQSLANAPRWLYATSEQEVAWLDRYGYPTPSEETFLLSADEATLQKLADAGDKNAALNLRLRETTRMVASKDFASASAVSRSMLRAAAEAGPYGHSKVVLQLGETLQAYKRAPSEEKSAEVSRVMNELALVHQSQRAISALYGDLHLDIGLRPYPSDLKVPESVDAQVIINYVTVAAETQRRKGLPFEVSFAPRPNAVDAQRSNSWLLRK
jgi:hypothetical protein